MKTKLLFALSVAGLAGVAPAVDKIQSKTTYAEAYGKTRNAAVVDPDKELPHYPAVEAAEAVSTWKVKPGFRIQLAAHEPLVRDPIAVCFDERGRMFVCEMIDYSEMRDVSPHLGRISVLEDRDGDGVYETGRVFAEDLPWPTGLIWANGALYVGATPDIWRLEDRDGDGRAEVREKVFTGFGTGLKILNVQGLLNSFQWGQDNRVHVLAGGGNRGVITSPVRPDLPGRELGGQDFWFDPLTHEFGMENGGAQYGMSFDDYGRKFGCSNADHLQYWVYEGNPGERNPYAVVPPSRRSIALDGGAAEVHRISPDEPWRIIRTRWRVSGTVPGAVEGGGRVSGYFTGATGTTVYRGDAYGEDFRNNSFTGDAGGQLVHRKKIRLAEDGVNLAGERPEDERTFEFAASRDTWVRVVNFANAPDGCLHVIDMYREVIEHPWSIPDEIKRHLDLNHGNDRGRIYRLVPETGAPRVGARVRLDEADTRELVALLSHPNGWHRDTAQRLLYERRDPGAVELVEKVLVSGNPVAKLHALGVLEGKKALRAGHLSGALADASPVVRERGALLVARLATVWTEGAGADLEQRVAQLAEDGEARVRFQAALTCGALLARRDSPVLAGALQRLALKDHAHAWIGPAVLSAPPAVVGGAVFQALTADPETARAAAPFVARLIEVRAASQSAEVREALIASLTREEPRLEWLRALSEGLRKGGTTLEQADGQKRLGAVYERASVAARAAEAPVAGRVGALEVLGMAPAAVATKVLVECAGSGQPDPVQVAALKALAVKTDGEATRRLVAGWSGFGAGARAVFLELMLARVDRQQALLEAVGAGEVPATALSAAQLQTLLKSKDAAVAGRARTVLAQYVQAPRSEVLARYQEAVTLSGDPGKGRVHFQQRCAGCHRAGGQGMEVGPDLVTVKNKGREALLMAVLDPNKEVAAQYIVYTVHTKDGGVFSGFISEDNASALTLRTAGGSLERIERGRIQSTTSGGLSLMPEGLEAGMSARDMADLLSFIEGLQ